MSDLAHVPAQRMQLRGGKSLDEVFASALVRGGARSEPPASDPRGSNAVRAPAELQAVIDEAGIGYGDCGRLSVALDWWNRVSDDADWQVSAKEEAAQTS